MKKQNRLKRSRTVYIDIWRSNFIIKLGGLTRFPIRNHLTIKPLAAFTHLLSQSLDNINGFAHSRDHNAHPTEANRAHCLCNCFCHWHHLRWAKEPTSISHLPVSYTPRTPISFGSIWTPTWFRDLFNCLSIWKSHYPLRLDAQNADWKCPLTS